MSFCRNCGTQLPPSAAFCSTCSTPTGLAAAPAPFAAKPVTPVQPYVTAYPAGAPAPKRSMLWPVLGTAAVILMIVAAIGVWGVQVAKRQAAAELAQRVATERSAIQAVLDKDDELSNVMKSATEPLKVETEDDINRYASFVEQYVASAREMDTSNCPRDFADAYTRHIAAWSDFAASMRAHPHIPSEEEAFVSGYIRGLNGDATGGAEQLTQEIASWRNDLGAKNEAIRATWQEVQRLKQNYGV